MESLSHADKLDFKKARSHKGRKIIDDLKPKEVEGPKQTLFVKGNKTSELVTKTLQNLYLLKKANSVSLNERWEIRPFETVDKLENLCNKKDCGLFVFGSNSKKRPNSLYIGRLFDEHLLDLVEFEIKNASNLDPKSLIVPDEKPCIIFQGDVFEYEANFMRIKNLIGDLFVENVQTKSINVKDGIHHFIVITGDIETMSLHIRQYELTCKTLDLVNAASDFTTIAKDIGPSIDLVYRRAKFATDDELKKACKQPKTTKPKHQKNRSTDELGQERGRIFVERQNLGELNLKKRKKLKTERPAKDGQESTTVGGDKVEPTVDYVEEFQDTN